MGLIPLQNNRMSMDNLILTLAVRWLHASDAIAAVQVCKEWNETLHSKQDGGNLWYQCCLNTNPLATAQLSQESNMDYRRLALGFIRKITSDITREENTLPPASPQDCFAVIDLYRTNDMRQDTIDIQASWVCPFDENGEIPLDKTTLQEVVLKGINPYSECNRQEYNHGTPLQFAIRHLQTGDDGTQPLCARVTLFRRDTLMSVCLVDGPFQASTYIESDSSRHLYLSFSGTQHYFSDNTATSQDYSSISTMVQLELCPLLPPPDSSQEPQWLVDCRNAIGSPEPYLPNDEALKALSNMDYFEFQIKQLSLKFYTSIQDDEDIFKQLCWK